MATTDRTLTRDVIAISAAVAIVGLSFGALAAAAGLSMWMSLAMSVLVLAGGSQFLAVAAVAAGGNPWTAALGGLLVNARHIPFGLSMSKIVGDHTWQKFVGAHILVDEVVAYSRAQSNLKLSRKAYWTCGVSLATTWIIATIIGGWLGERIPDPDRFGVDGAFPAALLALLLPSLRDSAAARRVAVTGAVIALAATPFLPPGLPVLVGLVGLIAAGKEPTK